MSTFQHKHGASAALILTLIFLLGMIMVSCTQECQNPSPASTSTTPLETITIPQTESEATQGMSVPITTVSVPVETEPVAEENFSSNSRKRPTLTLDPVTTTTETITLYLHNSTGGELMTRTKSKEILEVYQIEKLEGGEWQVTGSRMYELAGGSSTYKVHEIMVHTTHAPDKTVSFTIPVKAWCGSLLAPGEYRVPIRYGYILDEGWTSVLDAETEWHNDAWYFTVTE